MTLRSRAVDGVFGFLDLVASLYSWVQKLRRPLPRLGDTDPFPLEEKPRRFCGNCQRYHRAVGGRCPNCGSVVPPV